MEETYDFGKRLCKLRTDRKWTQERLADMIHKESSAISKYENNLQSPTFDTARSLARIFNVSMDYLAGTEKPTDITYGLNQEQREIISMLAKSFRQKNEAIPKIKNITESQYAIIGRIAVELSKTEY